ncbi:unnamed protein product [Vicia faba]|uniref:Uncharacterized protein n=1 Tax=Vicia faba TaxID=3906 RepID=A0AAV1AV60_VICFA|nr:unnamed protein product [Vicia faba]
MRWLACAALVLPKNDGDVSIKCNPISGEFRYFSLTCDVKSGDFESIVIILSDDSKMEGSSGEFLSDEVLSWDSSEIMFLVKSDEGENLSNKLIHLPVLTEAEIEVVGQRRERVGRLVDTYREVTNLE